MSRLAVKAIKIFEHVPEKMTAKFLSGVLKLFHPREKVVDENLKRAYPDSPPQWRNDIRSLMYENIAWTAAELFALKKNPLQAFQWVKKVHNIEFVDELIDSKKGAIFMSGHFGNWELMASWYAQHIKQRGHQMYVIAQPIHDKDVSAYIDGMRNQWGVDLLSSMMSVQKYVKLLRQGYHISLLNDVAGTGKMIVPFMGHDATNMPGPAIMSLLSGAPIVPVCIYRNAPFEHELEFFAPVKVPRENLNREQRIRIVIDECNKAIEKFIRRRPELWFWLHKRWKGWS